MDGMREPLPSVCDPAVESSDPALLSALVDPAPGWVLGVHRDRRAGLSSVVHASRMLAHATEHLVRAQMTGRGGPAVREAIGLLCEAGERLLETERRAESRAEMAGWMRGAQASRAKISHGWR